LGYKTIALNRPTITTTSTQPELINTSPYEDGWLLKLKVSDVDTSEFMTSEAYREFLETVDK